MVCAMQELAAAALAAASSEHNQQQQHQVVQQQGHQQYLMPQQQQQQTNQQQMTTIILVSTPATHLTQLQQQQQQQSSAQLIMGNANASLQRMPQNPKSQQLKQQHSALVKLLESAPLSKKTSPTPAQPSEQKPQVVCLPQQQSQLQQHLSCSANNTSSTALTKRKRLKNEGSQLQMLISQPPATTIVLETVNNNLKTYSITQEQSHPPVMVLQPAAKATAVITNQTADVKIVPVMIPQSQSPQIMQTKNDSESGIDEDAEEEEEFQQEMRNEAEKTIKNEQNALAASNNAAANEKQEKSAEIYEQCPWKKIRFAREWKQREQQQQKQAQNETNSLKTEAKAEDHLVAQTDKEIALMLQQQTQQQQQQRRDSSDSNSSLLSNSSTQSIPQCCTCTPQQLKMQQQALQRDSSDEDLAAAAATNGDRRRKRRLSQSSNSSNNYCNCNECSMQDMDSGCDDELCETHHREPLEQQTLNYLCQKFDENLETAASNGQNNHAEIKQEQQNEKDEAKINENCNNKVEVRFCFPKKSFRHKKI